MKPENSQWQQIRNDYLAGIEQALTGAPADERRQILDEVAVHLGRRFEELEPGEQTWEAMQAIVTDMGPVEDYAALLEEKAVMPPSPSKRALIFWGIGCLLLLILVGFFGLSRLLLHQLRQDARRPVVVATSPQTLKNDVNPDTAQIAVTFDQPMMNFSWSWVGGGEHFPATTGEPRYDSTRTTCTLPVDLEPGRWYWVGINSQKYVYFQTEKHIAAEPYVLLFATADENGNPTPIPQDYIDEAKRVNTQ